MKNSSGPTSPFSRSLRGWLIRGVIDEPALWALATFGVYFWYPRFIIKVAWNAIELIIAQHVLDHATYATSLDYPSALTWRPVLPTLVVTFCRIWTSDPMLIYRVICGLSFAILVVSMFFAARLMWGRLVAHVAAALTFLCPALGVYLVNHVHSYSHLVGMMVLGPTLVVSLFLLRGSTTGSQPGLRWYLLSGAAWGLSYLCRSELLLYFGVWVVLIAWRHWRGPWATRPLVACGVVFAVFFGTYNLYADHVAKRDGLLARKTIYTMYMSQGWVDPPADVGPDKEGDGYVYAIKLYGDPVANHESTLQAISQNLPAFARRVRLNLQGFYTRYFQSDFFPATWSLIVIAVAARLLSGRLRPQDRLPVLFLFGLFVASHFVLIFHIDARYLTVNVPPLILLVSFGVGEIVRRRPLGPGRARFILPTLVAAVLVYPVLWVGQELWSPPRDPNLDSIIALRSLGKHFRTVVPQPVLFHNREAHIAFIFPHQSSLYPEDQFLLAYYSHSAWVNGGAGGVFPRGKFYSYSDRETDYLYVPAERVGDQGLIGRGKIIDSYDNPVLGKYYIVQMNP